MFVWFHMSKMKEQMMRVHQSQAGLSPASVLEKGDNLVRRPGSVVALKTFT